MKLIVGIVAIGALIGLATLVPITKTSGQDISVYIESGKVSFKNGDASEYKEITEKKFSAKSGSYVKTDKSGTAHIVFPNNSVTSLGNSAEIKLEYADAGISITQLLGDTYHRVAGLAQGKSYEVRTPGTLAAVRGTKFAVSYNANAKKAKVAVTENLVAVSRENATGTEPTKVSVGSLATVDENLPTTAKKAISISLSKTDASMKNWLERNALIDQYAGDDPSAFFSAFVTVSGDSSNLKGLRDRLEKTKSSMTNKKTESSKGSLRTLLASGASQKCEYTITENDLTSSATIYLSGSKMRIDSKNATKTKTENSSMIIANQTMYIWGDDMQGIRMSVPDANTSGAGETGSFQMFDMDKEIGYSCSPWVANESYFSPPRNVQFMNIDQMVPQGNPAGGTMPSGGGADMQAMQCGACDTLPEPDRTACRQEFNCR